MSPDPIGCRLAHASAESRGFHRSLRGTRRRASCSIARTSREERPRLRCDALRGCASYAPAINDASTNAQNAVTTALTSVAARAKAPDARPASHATPPSAVASGAHTTLIQIQGPGSPSPQVATARMPVSTPQPATAITAPATPWFLPALSAAHASGGHTPAVCPPLQPHGLS